MIEPLKSAPLQTRAAALATIGAIGAAFLPRIAEAQAPIALVIAGVPEDSITPALYADQSGLFAENGLSVQVTPARSGSAIAAGVAGGAYQIAKSSLVGLIVARGKGIPFVLVAPGGYYASSAPHIAMLVAKDSPLKTAAKLDGKTIAVSALGDIYTLATKEWMAKNGGDADSIKLVEVPISAVADAIAGGRIDAGMLGEPFLARAIESGKVRVISHPMDAIANRFLYSGWFTTSDWPGAHAKESTAFAKAMRDASLYVNSHEPKTVAMLAKFAGIEPTDIVKMVRVENATALNPKEIQPVIDACARYKLIDAPFDARDMIAPALRSGRP